MADETPQATQTPAEAPAVEAPPPSGGFKAYLPLILAVVLMPGLALGTFKLKSMFDSKPAAAEPAEETKKEEPAPAAPGSTATAAPANRDWNTRLAVPLTRLPIAFKKADPSKAGDQDKFVLLDLKGDPKEVAQSDKIVVNVARTGAQRYAVVRLSLVSDAADFVERLNYSRERLIDIASGELSSKTIEEMDTPGFRNVFRSQLLAGFNRAFGANIVRDVIIDEFVVQ